MNIAQAKPLDEEHENLVAEFLAKGGQITTAKSKVEQREARRAPRITTADAKFDMYCNALPKALRVWARDTNQDVRALYKEYRELGAERLVNKYQGAE